MWIIKNHIVWKEKLKKWQRIVKLKKTEKNLSAVISKTKLKKKIKFYLK